MKKILQAVTLSVALVFVTAVANASETTGTLTTGIQTGMDGTVMQAPSASPAPGTYSSTQTVTLTAGAGASSIHYSTGATDPTCTDTNVYTGPINVASSMTIKAVSCYPGNNASAIASFSYTINTAPSGGGGGGGGSGGSGGGGGGGTICTADADFNNDGKVDIFDLNILTLNWGSTTATETTGDANCDSKVDIFDLNILTTNWTG